MKKEFLNLSKKFVTQKFKVTKPEFKRSVIANLESKSFEDCNGLAKMLSQNLNMKNSSQIYQTANDSYQAMIEFQSDSNLEVYQDKISHMLSNFPGLELKLVPLNTNSEREEFYLHSKGKNKKCSIFNNNKKVGGLIQCRLYPDAKGFQYVQDMRADDYGRFIEQLESNSEHFEIIEIQGVSDVQKGDPMVEKLRHEKMITLIRDNDILKRKLISVRTHQFEVAEHVLARGADIINDPTGGQSDPNIINLIAEASSPMILNLNFSDRRSPNFINSFIDHIKRSLDYYNSKGVLNSNIALDLNLDHYNLNYLTLLYENIHKIRQQFENVLISPMTVSNEAYATSEQVLNLLFKHVNIIRYRDFKNMEQIGNYIKENDLGEDLAIIERIAQVDRHEGVSDLPTYKFATKKERRDNFEELVDLTQVKKEDDLSMLLKKYNKH